MNSNAYITKLSNVDWEFLEDYTRYLTHDFHRYSSKFIPQIAGNLITIFSKEDETVLDVFVGSGTTLVEASILGRNSIGVDLNPLACLISEAKTTRCQENDLIEVVNNLLKKSRIEINAIRSQNNGQQPLELYGTTHKTIPYRIPRFPNIEKWFQLQVLKELSLIKDEINLVKDIQIKKFLICAFSAILRTVSNAHSSYGNLMINKNKPEVNNTLELFERQVSTMLEAIKNYNNLAKAVKTRVICANSENLSFISTNSVDLIVTHPPYVSAVPYAEYQKLSLRWLETSFPDIFDDGVTELLNPTTLDKKITGGGRSRGDVLERFIKSMQLIFLEMGRVLKPNHFCCVVIGHPTIRGKIAELKNEFLPLARKANLEHFHTVTRGNHRTTMGKMKKEYILIFKKG